MIDDIDFEFWKYYQENFRRTKYDGKRVKVKFKIGQVVRISKQLNHDKGYAGQLGIVQSYVGIDHRIDVMAWDEISKRYWVCGFKEEYLSLAFKYTIPEYQIVYEATKEWLARNDFAFKQDWFKELHEKFKKDFTKDKKV